MSRAVVPVSVSAWSLGNPGPAGWAWLRNADMWSAGGINLAVERDAHLLACAALLEAAPQTVPLLVYLDSDYAFNVCAKWIRGWSKRDWTRADGRTVANVELVKRVWASLEPRGFTRFELITAETAPQNHPVAVRLAEKAADRVAKNSRVDRVGPGWPQIQVSQPYLI